MKPILGPCPCQGCGEPLYFAKQRSRFLGNVVYRFGWREECGTVHRCPNWKREAA